jgi:hypothetical protein
MAVKKEQIRNITVHIYFYSHTIQIHSPSIPTPTMLQSLKHTEPDNDDLVSSSNKRKHLSVTAQSPRKKRGVAGQCETAGSEFLQSTQIFNNFCTFFLFTVFSYFSYFRLTYICQVSGIYSQDLRKRDTHRWSS